MRGSPGARARPRCREPRQGRCGSPSLGVIPAQPGCRCQPSATPPASLPGAGEETVLMGAVWVHLLTLRPEAAKCLAAPE